MERQRNCEKDKAILYLSGILHDVGKIEERLLDRNLRNYLSRFVEPLNIHANFSKKVVEDIFENFIEDEILKDILGSVKEIVGKHHQRDFENLLVKLIRKADWFISGEERRKKEREGYNELKGLPSEEYWERFGFKNKYQKGLRSVFSELFDADSDAYYKPQILDDGIEYNSLFYSVPFHNAVGQYPSHIIEYFKNDLRRILSRWNSEESFDFLGNPFFESLHYLVYKYFFLFPDAVGKDVESDVSLFEHLRLVAALSVALYETNSYNRFTWFIGDLSGIQNFIYSIPTKAAAKSLKARSLFLSLLTRIVAYFILSKFNLPTVNIIYCGGGGFQLILPGGRENYLKEIKKELDKKFFKFFEESLRINVSWVEINVDEVLGTQNYGYLREKFVEILSQLDKVKRSGSDKDILDENLRFNNFEVEEGFEVCRICGRRIKVDEMLSLDEEEGGIKVCKLCYSFATDMIREIRENAIERDGFLTIKKINVGGPNNRNIEGATWRDVFREFGFEVSFSNEPRADAVNYAINSFNFVEKGADGFIFLPVKLPVENGSITTFDNLAKGLNIDGKGVDKLAYFKMDVDNLGIIFAFGFSDKNYTMGRISTLSRLFDIFFSYIVYKIWGERSDYKNKVYIVYTGGDDTLSVGNWWVNFEFMKNIRKEFSRFVCHNEYVTLSAAYKIFDEKYPVYLAVDELSEMLEEAKGLKSEKKIIYRSGKICGNLNYICFPYKNKVNIEKVILNSENFVKFEGYLCRMLRYVMDGKLEELRRISLRILRFLPLVEDLIYKKTFKPRLIYGFRYVLRSYIKNQDDLSEFLKEMIEDWKNTMFEGFGKISECEGKCLIELKGKLFLHLLVSHFIDLLTREK